MPEWPLEARMETRLLHDAGLTLLGSVPWSLSLSWTLGLVALLCTSTFTDASQSYQALPELSECILPIRLRVSEAKQCLHGYLT